MKTRTALPARGRPKEDVLAELKTFGADDPHYQEGRLWSLVYYLDEDYASFLGDAYQAFSSANGLNPTAFKSLKRFENDIIASVAGLLHGTPEVTVLPIGLPGLPFHLRLDALAAYFLLVIGVASAGISVCAAGYFR